MRTSCTHCGTQFKVPDKTLGKQAKCKSCGKMFVITPAAKPETVPMQEVQPKRDRRAGDRKPPPPAPEAPAPESDDPLDALADAAIESGAYLAPVHHGWSNHRSGGARDEYNDRYGPRRMAKGAKAAMALGITAGALALIGAALGAVAMVQADNQQLLVTLGSIGIGVVALAAVLGMLAVVNGTTAGKQIRHARHPIGGRSEASTGTLMGWIALGLVFLAIVVGVIWLSQNRDKVIFKEEINAEGQVAPKAPTTE